MFKHFNRVRLALGRTSVAERIIDSKIHVFPASDEGEYVVVRYHDFRALTGEQQEEVLRILAAEFKDVAVRVDTIRVPDYYHEFNLFPVVHVIEGQILS